MSYFVTYESLYNMYWEFKDKLTNMINNIEIFKGSLSSLIQTRYITGQASDSLKAYFTEVHMPCLDAISSTAQILLDLVATYKNGYFEIDGSTNFKLDDSKITKANSKFEEACLEAADLHDRVKSVQADLEYAKHINLPHFSDIEDGHSAIKERLDNLVTNFVEYEDLNKAVIDSTIYALLTNVNAAVALCQIMSQYDPNAYVPNSVYDCPEMLALQWMTSELKDAHEANKEMIDAIMKNENDIKDQADDRVLKGIVETALGVTAIIGGVTLLVVSGGTSSGLVVYGTVLTAGGVACGASDTFEGVHDVYLGCIGDVDSEALNPIKEYVCFGNDYVYTGINCICGSGEGILNAAKEVSGPVTREVTMSIVKEQTKDAVIDTIKETACTKAGEKAGEFIGKKTDFKYKETLTMLSGMAAGKVGPTVGDKCFNGVKKKVTDYRNSRNTTNIPSVGDGASAISGAGNSSASILAGLSGDPAAPYHIDAGSQTNSSPTFGGAASGADSVVGPMPFSAD